MQIIEDKALIVNTRHPDRITNTIKKSANLGDLGGGVFGVLVHWSLKAAQTLRQLKIKNVPSPIVRDYDWPGRYKPFIHQRTTAEFLTLHKKSFCFSETGTGKTASAIWAADYLMTQGLVRRVLVIGPLSILHSAWLNELFKLVPHRTAAIAHGNPDKRRKIITGDYEFVIINFDGVEIVRDEIRDAGTFDLVIIDEGNAVKTTTTRRWKIINSLIRADSWVWLMTGTPAAQSPVDAYGLAKMVVPSKAPTFFGTFRDQVMWKQGMFTWIPRPNADTIVHNLLQPAIRFTKEECLDLPEMLYQDREVELTAQQLKYYKLLKEEMAMGVAGQDVSAVNAAVMMGKLLQISAGSVYSDEKEVVEFDCGNRLNVLEEIINEASHKVLVFAQYTHNIDRIKEYLTKKGHKAEVIDGRVGMNKRTDIIKRFQDPNVKDPSSPRILVIQPQAAGHGITLTAANVVVWFSPTLSLESYIQANARVNRPGQVNKMTVVHLQGSPVERKIYKSLREKNDLHIRVVDLYKEEVNDTRLE